MVFSLTVAALPICLLENSNVPLIGRRASLVGWGKTPGQEGMVVFLFQLRLEREHLFFNHNAVLICIVVKTPSVLHLISILKSHYSEFLISMDE
jgi:hypothetical protein